MKKIDLHVHSKFSDQPSEWVLQRIGTSESYTTIEQVYQMAKARGMSYVTLTDHDTIAGSLKLVEFSPHDCFTGVEVTTRFPEDGCKVHLLVYDLNQEQFQQINKIRANIYLIRDYLKAERLPHSLAHATFALNGKLSMDVYEKLILLFDVFEGINGARNPRYNQVWMQTLNNLQPKHIDELYQKHRIEPISSDPWIKGFTGGSDDHAGLFIGQTYTLAESATKQDFINAIRDKKTIASGRSNDYKSKAFIFYKIGYDFSKQVTNKKKSQLWQLIHKIVFEGKSLNLKEWIILQKMKRSKKEKDRLLACFIDHLGFDLKDLKFLTTEKKIELIYENIASLSDGFFKIVMDSISTDLNSGDMAGLIKKISCILPNMYIFAPFFMTLKHLHSDRGLIDQLEEKYIGAAPLKQKKVLWFSDTIKDLNGVSVTLQNLIKCAHANKMFLKFVTCHPNIKESEQFPNNVINLSSVYEYQPEFYNSYKMFFPSLLKSLETIQDLAPSEIIISTPGPVGLVGMISAKILGIKCSGVYHTDFSKQTDYILGDGIFSKGVEKYTHWFYSLMDEIRVPTKQYIDILAERGFEKTKMKVFRRGIDLDTFNHQPEDIDKVKQKYNIKNGFTLIYAGRVSCDKSVDFLAKIYKELVQNKVDINLIIAGDGPALEGLKEDLQGYKRVVFTGRVDRQELSNLYAASDLFVFPSTTDTFGMVVLESFACGLPVIVSDIGGPQEIVKHGKTGFILAADDLNSWVTTIEEVMFYKERESQKFFKMKYQAREFVEKNFSWEKALNDIIGTRLKTKQTCTEIYVEQKKRALGFTDNELISLIGSPRTDS